MNINGKHFRTICIKENDDTTIQIIDQRSLPYKFIIEDLKTVDEMAVAIKDMHVRGAPLIGISGAFGMYLATLENKKGNFVDFLRQAAEKLKQTRPTAIDLAWAVDKQFEAVIKLNSREQRINTALQNAKAMADESAEQCRQIGQHGCKLIEEISNKKNKRTVNILTHCNAGWLACVDYGTATSPIYTAFDKGIDIHVWVDETRPRNQGARLTAWELLQHGVPHTIIVDNAGGHLMQHNLVDIVITGTDRTTYTGDAANKIGTYLKALAAKDNGIPFYVALPSSTFDWKLKNGIKEIPIEERDGEEIKYIEGQLDEKIERVLLTPKKSPVANYGFDITPARLITGLITERGICEADEKSILNLYPEHKNNI